jgi:hypothetical protein
MPFRSKVLDNLYMVRQNPYKKVRQSLCKQESTQRLCRQRGNAGTLLSSPKGRLRKFGPSGIKPHHRRKTYYKRESLRRTEVLDGSRERPTTGRRLRDWPTLTNRQTIRNGTNLRQGVGGETCLRSLKRTTYESKPKQNTESEICRALATG